MKAIRIDNGLEFLSRLCQQFFIDQGIHHQRTCTSTPQQNGDVERKHWHLIQVARALMHHASLPLKFWSEAVLLAAYIINRLPTPILNWNTPYKLLYGKDPTYDHLEVFGCLHYVVDTTPHQDKFASRTPKCIFLGYTFGQKGTNCTTFILIFCSLHEMSSSMRMSSLINMGFLLLQLHLFHPLLLHLHHLLSLLFLPIHLLSLLSLLFLMVFLLIPQLFLKLLHGILYQSLMMIQLTLLAPLHPYLLHLIFLHPLHFGRGLVLSLSLHGWKIMW